MTNPQTTKLRLLAERARREAEAKERAALEARREHERRRLAYVEAMRADGRCAVCEKSLGECKCTFMGEGHTHTICDNFERPTPSKEPEQWSGGDLGPGWAVIHAFDPDHIYVQSHGPVFRAEIISGAWRVWLDGVEYFPANRRAEPTASLSAERWEFNPVAEHAIGDTLHVRVCEPSARRPRDARQWMEIRDCDDAVELWIRQARTLRDWLNVALPDSHLTAHELFGVEPPTPVNRRGES